MGAKKTIQFNKEKVSASTIYLAISHPARLQMIEIIQTSNYVRAKELQKMLGLSKSSILYHLDVLKEAGIVKYEYQTHHYLLFFREESLRKAFNYMKNSILGE